jgi:hypothetical protein
MMMGKTIFACLLIATIATAIPNNEIVPEEDYDAHVSVDYDTHTEAAKDLASLLQAGKTKDACAQLADSTLKEVSDSIASVQTLVNAVPKGAVCKNEGQAAVDSSKKQLDAAKTKAAAAKKAAESAKTKPVKFKDVTIAEIKAGDCSAFFSDSSFTAAKTAAQSAADAHAKADGELKAAQKAHDNSLTAQKAAVHACACHAQTKHAEAKKAADKANSSENAKAWSKAYSMKCVLDSKTAASCKIPTIPKVTMPALQEPAKSAQCGAKAPATPAKAPAAKAPAAKAPAAKPCTGFCPPANKIEPPGNAWIVDKYQEVWVSESKMGDSRWKLLSPKFKQIAAASGGKIWGIDKDGSIYNYQRGIGERHVHGKLTNIAVNAKGVVWGVNKKGNIYTRPGISGNWKHISGNLVQIAVNADGRVWGVNKEGDVLTRPGISGNWQRISGKLTNIAVFGDDVWGINKNGDIFSRKGVSGTWKQIVAPEANGAGKPKQISVGAGGHQTWGSNILYVVTTTDKIYTNAAGNGLGHKWTQVIGTAVWAALE